MTTLRLPSPSMLDQAPHEIKQRWNARIRWRLKAHRFQIAPAGEWRGWMMQAGRGSGKTRTGAQDAVEYGLDHPKYRYAVVAPTQGDVRKTCFEGESGIVAVLEEFGVSSNDYEWRRSDLELELANGFLMQGFSSEKPDRLRGPQFHRAWLDEAAAWKDAHLGDVLDTTFNNLGMGLRLGEDARMLITTTPKRVALIRELAARDDVTVTRGTTYDNLGNLAPSFAQAILRYEGSTIGRQELMGELIEDVEGALWKLAMIEASRVPEAGPMGRIIIGVDPAGSIHTETGIVAAGVTAGACVCDKPRENLPHAYVLGDWSIASTPGGWGQAVVEAYDHTSADRVVGERNYGGDMVEKVIRSVRPGIPFGFVTAARGKILRAEPISALYEQGRVHHVGYLPELEEEMTTYTKEDPWSPNRLDAMVWAVTELGLHKNVEATLSGTSARRKV